jgi:hypothetical protein
MKKIVRGAALAFGLVAALGLATGVSADEKKEKPSATLKLESKSVAVGVGFSWGEGTLRYDGKTYPVEVDGLTVGQVGASTVSATGDVYHLKKLSDFDGTYTAVSGGATLGGGGGGLAMRNQNGVVIEITGTSQGVNLTAGVSGVKLAVKK